MAKSVLIIGAEKSSYLKDLEKKIFSLGFETLFVCDSNEALDKLEHELFNIIIYELKSQDLDKVDFVGRLATNPFAAITPLVILKDPKDSREIPKLSSILDQTFATDTSPEFVADYVKETDELKKKKVKKGNISSVSMTRVLFDAYFFKFTGAAIFERLAEKKIIYFEDGSVVFASSNKPNERFGKFIVSQGLISEKQLSQALEISQKSSLRFGQILVEMGYIKEDTLLPLLQSQVKHILFSIFDWEVGDFFLFFEETSTIKDVTTKFKTPLLISEGIKRRFNASQMIRLLSPLNRAIRIDKGSKLGLRDFPFTQEESNFVEKIRDGETIEGILKSSFLGELETLRMLYLIYSINVLKIADDGETIIGEVVSQKDVKDKSKPGKKPKIDVSAVKSEPAAKLRDAVSAIKPTKIVPMVDNQALDLDETTGEDEVKLPKRLSLFWKGFITAIVLIVLFIFGLYFYVNRLFMTDYSSKGDSKQKQVASYESKDEKFQNVKKKEEGGNLDSTKIGILSKPAEKVSVSTLKMIGDEKVKTQERGTARETVQEKRTENRDTLFFNHLTMGRKFYKEGKPELAVKEFEKSYRINPKNDALLVEMGQALFELNRSVEAIEKYKEAGRVNPNNPLAHLYLGNIYQFHGKNRLAIEEYNTYLKLVPNAPQSTEVRRVLNQLRKEGK